MASKKPAPATRSLDGEHAAVPAPAKTKPKKRHVSGGDEQLDPESCLVVGPSSLKRSRVQAALPLSPVQQAPRYSLRQRKGKAVQAQYRPTTPLASRKVKVAKRTATSHEGTTKEVTMEWTTPAPSAPLSPPSPLPAASQPKAAPASPPPCQGCEHRAIYKRFIKRLARFYCVNLDMGLDYVLHYLEYKIMKEPKECAELAFRLKLSKEYAEWNKQRLYREADALVEAECDAIIAKRKLRELEEYVRDHIQAQDASAMPDSTSDL